MPATRKRLRELKQGRIGDIEADVGAGASLDVNNQLSAMAHLRAFIAREIVFMG
jgi:hypothetical protein